MVTADPVPAPRRSLSYLFNCGEGTQRLSHERKTRLARLENVFVTCNGWRNVGGVLGALLTLNDIGVPGLTLHGPPGLVRERMCLSVCVGGGGRGDCFL